MSNEPNFSPLPEPSVKQHSHISGHNVAALLASGVDFDPRTSAALSVVLAACMIDTEIELISVYDPAVSLLKLQVSAVVPFEDLLENSRLELLWAASHLDSYFEGSMGIRWRVFFADDNKFRIEDGCVIPEAVEGNGQTLGVTFTSESFPVAGEIPQITPGVNLDVSEYRLQVNMRDSILDSKSLEALMPQDVIDTYMAMTFTVASLSKCMRRKTGAIVVEIVDLVPTVIGSGCNGGEAGGTNVCEVDATLAATKPEIIHAEANALRALHDIPVRGKRILFCTDSPCEACLSLIEQHHVDAVLFGRGYRIVHHLANAKLPVVSWPASNMSTVFDATVNHSNNVII